MGFWSKVFFLKIKSCFKKLLITRKRKMKLPKSNIYVLCSVFGEKEMLKASEVVNFGPGLWSFCYWRPYMIWWLPSHIFLSLIYLTFSPDLFGVSFVYFPCTLVVPLFCLHIYRTTARVYERLYCNYREIF